MSCRHHYPVKPGKVIMVDKSCETIIIHTDMDEYNKILKWDKFFLTQCQAYASNSSCLSRQIGVVLVRDNTVIAGGYNGPPRGIPHCEGKVCPRKLKKNYKSGEVLDKCPAAHAEANAIINAAREGVTTKESTLYINTEVLPCKECIKLIINAGIVEIVALGIDYYDDYSKFLYENSKIKTRRFTCEY